MINKEHLTFNSVKNVQLYNAFASHQLFARTKMLDFVPPPTLTQLL